MSSTSASVPHKTSRRDPPETRTGKVMGSAKRNIVRRHSRGESSKMKKDALVQDGSLDYDYAIDKHDPNYYDEGDEGVDYIPE
mmetsp:Transcript_12053/g.18206  ORF Transcript_12053/g.18206 Transcript_12053/m.18206 type:complete len:83 (-) Transcript_12053:241-489(-)|eukprot:CAMPEP_0185024510 /NCGR_PEP_ID=MMETSP1103-20130426/7598_1 /TAXON_ID=36769 /ORGANISM="Paraphysomonas bandaiensis, Strain Caron Lab Isolate" /LENGTH=82 /DNA_ID=CAMNT_0027557495 /DNA_START=89 /DNA_END=337 /DNA_ORIENTATION=+